MTTVSEITWPTEVLPDVFNVGKDTTDDRELHFLPCIEFEQDLTGAKTPWAARARCF
jgi:hypothetical protein